MLNKLILFIISIGDYFHKKKIIKFFKKSSIDKFDCIFDIGAHQGESIKFFLSNFNVKKIYSFEPIPDIFEILQIEIQKFLRLIFIGVSLKIILGQFKKLKKIKLKINFIF